MRCHTNVGARFHSRTEVPDSGRARLSGEALGNCNLSSNGYLSLRASWRSFGEGVADNKGNASRTLSVARAHEPRDRPRHRDYGAGSKELSAEHVRQTRSLEPAGTGALRRQPWWLEMERRVWFEA